MRIAVIIYIVDTHFIRHNRYREFQQAVKYGTLEPAFESPQTVDFY
jgi:hypothetical protein